LQFSREAGVLALRRSQTGFMAGLKEGVKSKAFGLLLNYEVLSCSIAPSWNESGLDRSSSKRNVRCLQGCRTEASRR